MPALDPAGFPLSIFCREAFTLHSPISLCVGPFRLEGLAELPLCPGEVPSLLLHVRPVRSGAWRPVLTRGWSQLSSAVCVRQILQTQYEKM